MPKPAIPSARQAEMLRRAAQKNQPSTANPDGLHGFPPLGFGGHQGTYNALLRKGWMVERRYQRKSRWGFNDGCLAQITDAGRAALARATGRTEEVPAMNLTPAQRAALAFYAQPAGDRKSPTPAHVTARWLEQRGLVEAVTRPNADRWDPPQVLVLTDAGRAAHAA